MGVSVKSTSSRSCQRAFRGEVLYFTPKNAKNGRFSHGFEIPQSGIMEVSMRIYETNREEETFEIGRKLGEEAEKGQIFTLIGDLGVGKTVFTKGVAAGLGIREPVNSPTFTIVQVYEEGRLPFYHFDVYRISDVEEMEEIGYEDYFYGEGVCMIEWADLIRELLPEKFLQITIEKDLQKGFDYRKIIWQEIG